MAEYDGNIKLGVSINADTKSVSSQLQSVTQEIKKSFSGVSKEVNSIPSSVKNVTNTIKETVKNVSSLDSKLSGVSNTTRRIELSQLKDGLKESQKEVDFFQKKLQTLESSKTDTLIKHGPGSSQYANLNKEIEATKRSLETRKSDVIDYENQIAQVKHDILEASIQKDLESEKKKAEKEKLLREQQAKKNAVPETGLGKQYSLKSTLQSDINQFRKSGTGFENLDQYKTAQVLIQSLVRNIRQAEAELKSGFSTDNMTVSNQKLLEMGNELDRLKEKKKSMEQAGATIGYKEFDDTIKQIQKLEDKYDEAVNKHMTSGWDKVKEKISGVVGVIKKAAKHLPILGKAGKKSGNDMGKGFKRGLMTMTKLAFGVRSMFMLFRRLRQVAIKALNTIATQFPEVNAELSQTKTLFEGLKGAFGTALQPIISALLPVINQVIQGLTVLLQKIGSVFAALSGQGYIYKATANWQDYADAVDGANKKLGAYDKLNVIGDQNNSNTLDVTYEKQDVDKGIADMIDKIKEAWNNSDFTDIGVMMGQKLQEGLNYLRTEVLPQIDELGIKLASSISTFFNGLFSVKGLGADLGATLADVINIVIHFFDTLLTKFDFASLGAFIFETLQSGILNIDWSSFGHALGEIPKALFDFFKGAIQSIDWVQLTKDVYQKVKDFLMGVDWAGIASSAFEALGSAIAAAIQVLWTFIKEVASDLGAYFNEGFVEGICKLFNDIDNWLKTNVVEPFINGFKKLFGIASPSKVMKEMGGYIVEGFIEPIKQMPAKVLEWFTNLKTKLLDVCKQIAEKVKTTFNGLKDSISSIFQTLLKMIKTPINGIIGLVNGLVRGLISGINACINALNKLSVKVPSWVPIYGGKSFGFNLGTLSTPQIPYLAQGAVIPPNKEFLAVLGDQNQGTNIEAPLDTIKQAVAEVLAQMGTNSHEDIVLKLDGKTVAKVVWSENQKRYKQTGAYGY